MINSPGFSHQGPSTRPHRRSVDAAGARFDPELRPAGHSAPSAPSARGEARPARVEPSFHRVLSPLAFEAFLERERSLADRGTRRFCLLVLHRREPRLRPGRADSGLTALGRYLSRCLRATDLVGRLDRDRLAILLTDTEPAGAQVVAAWVRQVEAKLVIDIDQAIYVYPGVGEPTTAVATGSTSASGPSEDATPRGPHALRLAPAERSRGRSREWPVSRSSAGRGGAPSVLHLLTRLPATSLQGPAMGDLWPLLCVRTTWWRRMLDRLLAGFALLLCAPVFLVIATAIRLEASGPVIFRQMRAGHGGRPFVFYKFRSMVPDAEAQLVQLIARNEQAGPVFKMRRDPRVTRVGRFLRRSSLDELPQLWNVLKGDLALVGPRSPTLDEVGRYARWQRRRLCVPGGLTCTWQVSGRSQIVFEDWMRLDLRYLARRGFWFDLGVVVRTLPAVVSGRGAC